MYNMFLIKLLLKSFKACDYKYYVIIVMKKWQDKLDFFIMFSFLLVCLFIVV